MSSPEVRAKADRPDKLLPKLEEHLRMGFSAVLIFEDPAFSVTGVDDTTAAVREARGINLPVALQRFLKPDREAGG